MAPIKYIFGLILNKCKLVLAGYFGFIPRPTTVLNAKKQDFKRRSKSWSADDDGFQNGKFGISAIHDHPN